MPVVRSSLDPERVIPILRNRGYGVNQNHRFGLQLTVKTARKFSNGTHLYEPLKGISREDYTAILERCDTPEEAALKIEALSKGEILSAVEETRSESAATGLTAEQLATIIDNRVKNGVAAENQAVMAEILALRNEMREALAEVRKVADAFKPANQKRGPGRPPKNAKNPSKVQVDKMVASLNIPSGPPEQPAA